jgi:hypothetical protein
MLRAVAASWQPVVHACRHNQHAALCSAAAALGAPAPLCCWLMVGTASASAPAPTRSLCRQVFCAHVGASCLSRAQAEEGVAVSEPIRSYDSDRLEQAFPGCLPAQTNVVLSATPHWRRGGPSAWYDGENPAVKIPQQIRSISCHRPTRHSAAPPQAPPLTPWCGEGPWRPQQAGYCSNPGKQLGSLVRPAPGCCCACSVPLAADKQGLRDSPPTAHMAWAGRPTSLYTTSVQVYRMCVYCACHPRTPQATQEMRASSTTPPIKLLLLAEHNNKRLLCRRCAGHTLSQQGCIHSLHECWVGGLVLCAACHCRVMAALAHTVARQPASSAIGGQRVCCCCQGGLLRVWFRGVLERHAARPDGSLLGGTVFALPRRRSVTTQLLPRTRAGIWMDSITLGLPSYPLLCCCIDSCCTPYAPNPGWDR